MWGISQLWAHTTPPSFHWDVQPTITYFLYFKCFVYALKSVVHIPMDQGKFPWPNLHGFILQRVLLLLAYPGAGGLGGCLDLQGQLVGRIVQRQRVVLPEIHLPGGQLRQSRNLVLHLVAAQLYQVNSFLLCDHQW